MTALHDNADDYIAIDGFAASGKGTVAMELSRVLGIPYLGVGNLLRAFAYALQKGGESSVAAYARMRPFLDQVSFTVHGTSTSYFFEGRDITLLLNNESFAESAAELGALREVQSFISYMILHHVPKRVIVEGRNIGTDILPRARWKFFLFASESIRADRRHAEYVARGEKMTREETMRQLHVRDQEDQRRVNAPLRPAADAILLDTSFHPRGFLSQWMGRIITGAPF